MAQKVKSTIKGTLSQVIATLTNEDFCRHNAEQAGGKLTSLRVSGDTENSFIVTTEGVVPEVMLPDVAKKFLGSGVPLTYEQRWKAPEADGSRTAEVTISVKNGLVSVAGTQTFTPNGSGGVDSVFDGKAKSTIPFVGGKIAAIIEPKFTRAIEIQANAISDWIAEHR